MLSLPTWPVRGAGPPRRPRAGLGLWTLDTGSPSVGVRAQPEGSVHPDSLTDTPAGRAFPAARAPWRSQGDTELDVAGTRFYKGEKAKPTGHFFLGYAYFGQTLKRMGMTDAQGDGGRPVRVLGSSGCHRHRRAPRGVAALTSCPAFSFKWREGRDPMLSSGAEAS